MNKKNRIVFSGMLFIFLLTTGSCVTSVSPKLNPDDSKPLLVVEGQITDQEGPFRVKLTTTVGVSDTAVPKPVLNADINIIDDQGHTFRLYGSSNGIYETAEKNLKGIPGNKYTLMVTTAEDGFQYTSMPVLMQEVPDIDSLYFEEVTHPRITQGIVYEDTWLNVLLNAHDPAGKTRYWRWEYEETWEVNLVADEVKVYHNPNDPRDNDWHMMSKYDIKKILCWTTRPTAYIVVANTANNPVDELKAFIVRSLGPGEARLHIRYSILIKQYSIEADLYNYWKLLRDVNENSGGIYSKIPAPVFGNITCCDGAGKALGYFAASSVKEKRLFISRSEHHVETHNVNLGCGYYTYGVPPMVQKIWFGAYSGPGGGYIDTYTSSKDCADCTMYATNVKPSFW
jgi:hypothetical protein